jgi:hypothetical protein
VNASRIKIASASIAFVPLIIALVQAFGTLQQRAVQMSLAIFYFPVLGLQSLLRTFHLGQTTHAIITFILMVMWSSLVAAIFWKIASGFLAEDEPDRKFDWIGFQVRFACGAVVGALLGWRFWIRLYRGYGDGPKNTWVALFICVILGAAITGLTVGLGYREDFWRRPPL